MKTLKEYAEENRIHYRTAWNHFREGKISGAFKNGYGKVLIPDENMKPEYTVCYARVSSSENRKNLESQAERLCSYCAAKGYKISEVIKECASGLNDTRPKLEKLLKNSDVTRIVTEHKDRLTRFGFNYIKLFKKSQGCQIEIINESANDRDELMQDFVRLVTCFTAGLYGLRRSRRKTEKLIRELENENNEVIENNDSVRNTEKA